MPLSHSSTSGRRSHWPQIFFNFDKLAQLKKTFGHPDLYTDRRVKRGAGFCTLKWKCKVESHIFSDYSRFEGELLLEETYGPNLVKRISEGFFFQRAHAPILCQTAWQIETSCEEKTFGVDWWMSTCSEIRQDYIRYTAIRIKFCH